MTDGIASGTEVVGNGDWLEIRSPAGGITGRIHSGFREVLSEFQANFTDRGEVGAAFSVNQQGVTLVDLWGGTADRSRANKWRADTLQLIFSGTKGVCATCLCLLVGRGKLNLEDTVSSWWPEFGASGKEQVTAGELASHRARLPVIRTSEPLPPEAMLDGAALAAQLAAQPQESDDRTDLTYHALTYGWLVGELVRRVDGRTIGRFWREEIADRLDLDVWIGLPRGELKRLSTLEHDAGFGRTYYDRAPLSPDPWLDWRRNPEAFGRDRIVWNEEDFLLAEVPGVNGVATARSMAALYSELANPSASAISGLTPEAVALCTEERSAGWDRLNDEDLRFGAGFALQVDERFLGPPADAFGHAGAGGSVHAAWPSHRAGGLIPDERDARPRGRRPPRKGSVDRHRRSFESM